MRKKTILVTGGAGFIGSHLCERMINDGYRVVCLDNLDDYYDPKVKKDNLKLSFANENFVFVKGDIRDNKVVDQLFKRHKFSLVVHLAAKAGVRPSIEQPMEYADVNINGTLVLLEACRQHKINKIVFASSSSVYGLTDQEFFSEADAANLPISPYGATKKAGEMLCHTYHHLYKTSFVCLRFFTVYGPRQRPDLAIHKFTRLISEDREITVFGDGTTRRDYTYISDIIDGIMKSIGYLEKAEHAVYEVVNLGRSEPVLLKKLLGLIQEKVGKKARIRRLPKQPGDLDSTFADIAKAQRLFAYRPSTPINDGIDKFSAWFRGSR